MQREQIDVDTAQWIMNGPNDEHNYREKVSQHTRKHNEHWIRQRVYVNQPSANGEVKVVLTAHKNKPPSGGLFTVNFGTNSAPIQRWEVDLHDDRSYESQIAEALDNTKAWIDARKTDHDWLREIAGNEMDNAVPAAID